MKNICISGKRKYKIFAYIGREKKIKKRISNAKKEKEKECKKEKDIKITDNVKKVMVNIVMVKYSYGKKVY